MSAARTAALLAEIAWLRALLRNEKATQHFRWLADWRQTMDEAAPEDLRSAARAVFVRREEKALEEAGAAFRRAIDLGCKMRVLRFVAELEEGE